MSFTLIRARIAHHYCTRADGRIDNELINAPLDWLATTLNKSSLLYPGNITNHSIMDMQILDTIAQNHPALRITIRCRRYINWSLERKFLPKPGHSTNTEAEALIRVSLDRTCN